MATAFDDAVARVLAECVPLPAERVGFAESAGYVLAADVAAPADLPAFDNSAMDGYAVRSTDTHGAPVRLGVQGESRAGAPWDGVVAPGFAVRVSTGAAMPAGADAVVRVEDTSREGDEVTIGSEVTPGHDVRPAGDDVHRGDRVIAAGSRVGAGEVAVMAAVGAAEVAVRRRPRVAIVATGDELVPPGEPLGAGQIYDSNSYMVECMVREAGGEVVSVRRGVGDTAIATAEALAGAFAGADVVITLGGVSMGEHDHMKAALRDAGVDEAFWRVALRPGHPTWFGLRDRDGRRTLVFGLPGNPGSAFVTFHLFVAPALAALMGAVRRPFECDAVYRGAPQTKRPGMVMALRVALSNADGALEARLTSGNQRSHAMTALAGADALALVSADSERLGDGDRVSIRLLPAAVT